VTGSRHRAWVFDLDGVVRDFGPGSADAAIEDALGLPRGSVAATAFRPDLVGPTVTGVRGFDEWFDAVCAALAAMTPETEPATGTDPAIRAERRAATVRRYMQAWRDHRGEPVAATVEALERLRHDGRPTYLFTNGTDLITHELDQLGLSYLFDAVVNSAVTGLAKPDPASFAAAHAVIEGHQGRALAPADVWFTDDRPENVAAARAFGWDASLFTGSVPTLAR
jgi:putative hydrolase of the HAD superfamily